LPVGDDLLFYGRVTDRETDAPIAGAEVELLGSAGAISGSRASSAAAPKTATSGADGRFEMRLASWKPHSLRVEAAGFGRAYCDARDGHDMPEKAMHIRLSRGATLRLRVVDVAGTPLEGLRIDLKTPAY